ncbi:hypothetical protein ALO92_100908 [Pseudomonas congelans]|uniref:Uncharacterized protein n=1 Tax=Pseudomonas congelans TaxID=200452 RepID=A0A0N8R2F4_9PSED|nr:hypothetical protein ALO92_100908 [Pseudomonas congelans]
MVVAGIGVINSAATRVHPSGPCSSPHSLRAADMSETLFPVTFLL